MCHLQQLKNRSFHVTQSTYRYMLRGVWQALNCLSIHATYCVIVVGASPGETKRIWCLQIVSQHVPIYLQQFPSYSNCKCKKSPFSRTAAHIFVSPGYAPGAITLNVVWMEREFDAYKLSRSVYPSIFNSFPVIRTASTKNRRFHVPQPTFLFPLETPLQLSRNIVTSMERQFNACQTPCCMYLSIFNSFRGIRCLSQCASPKISIFTTFLFPLGTPLGQSR